MSQMNVQIVTPDGLVYDHHAAFVSVKTIAVSYTHLREEELAGSRKEAASIVENAKETARCV